MLEVINPYTLRILVAVRKVDSIRAVSKRISLSYAWTYKWVLELEKLGVFVKKGKKVFLQDNNKFYLDSLDFIRKTFKKDVSFHYKILELFGIKYCFTATDAVFIWTDGGYNVSRYRKHYPIFIKLRKKDRELFEFYIKKLKLTKNIFYKPLFLDDFHIFLHRNMPIDSLDETIEFMKKYIYNFEPALEMVKEMYKKKLKIKYKEVVRNV